MKNCFFSASVSSTIGGCSSVSLVFKLLEVVDHSMVIRGIYITGKVQTRCTCTIAPPLNSQDMHALVVSWSFCSTCVCVSCSSSLHPPVLLHFWFLSKSLFSSCLSCQLPFIKASLRVMSTKTPAASASFPCRGPYQGPIKKAFLACNYRNKWHTQSFNSYPSIHHRLGEGVQNSPTSSCFSANSAFLLAHSTFKFNAQQTKVDRNQWTNVNLWHTQSIPSDHPACFFCISSLDQISKFPPDRLRSRENFGLPNNFSCACCCLLCWNSASAFSCRKIRMATWNAKGVDLRKGTGRCWFQPSPLTIEYEILYIGSAHSMAIRNPASPCPYLSLEKKHPSV